MKKKILLGLIASVMSLSLVACGGDKKEEAKASELKDGTYEVENNADDKGNKAKLVVEVKDGKIATVQFNEFNEETGVNKRDNAEYNEKMKSVSGTNPSEAEPALEAQLLEKQSADVDGVTGATGTTGKFKAMAEKALENAKAGNTEKVTGDFK